jgi:hypothetical protein
MAAIARKADFTPEKVAFFLRDPHPKMPNFPLSRSEAADIGTLRKWGLNTTADKAWHRAYKTASIYPGIRRRYANPCR